MPITKTVIVLSFLLFASFSIASMKNCPPSKPDCDKSVVSEMMLY